MPPPGKGPAWSWFSQHQHHKKEAEEKKLIPNNCGLCGAKIESEDIYWLGIDRYGIGGVSCDNARCKIWFEQKIKSRKE